MSTITAPKTASTTDRGWRGAFRDLAREHGYEPLRVEGQIPDGLSGTLYRNGPALFQSQGRRYGHWFDGDGAITGVRFARGTATGAIKLVQSAGLVAEREAGRPLCSAYGTRPPGSTIGRLRRSLKNAANTSVMVWQDRLYALFEGDNPTEISPLDLSTLGERDLGGVVTHAFSAHPHYLPNRHAAYNFGVRYGRATVLDLYELPDTGPARQLGSVPLSGATMIHDFIATPRYLVFFPPPLRMDIPRFLLGMASYSESLRWKPVLGTEIIVVPIDEPEKVVRFEVEAFYQWHFSNAFERDDKLVVDFVRYPDFSSNAWLSAAPSGDPPGVMDGTFHRATIDLARQSLEAEQVWTHSCEFPQIRSRLNGQPYRYAYLAAADQPSTRDLHDQLARLDVETGAAVSVNLGDGQTPSEPVFVTRPGSTAEDDGYVLTLVYDAPSDRSHIAILNAHAMEDGPIARVWFDHPIPPTFHGIWSAA